MDEAECTAKQVEDTTWDIKRGKGEKIFVQSILFKAEIKVFTNDI